MSDLDQRIQRSGRHLLHLVELYGDDERCRKAWDEHRGLLLQRTPEDHAEMARRAGLPFAKDGQQ